MSISVDHTMTAEPPVSLIERTGLIASWVLSAAVFLSLGWMAMAPDDPYGAVSILARADGLSMLIQSAALAVVVAGLGAVLSGRRLTDAGTLAAAIGLAAASLRGATSEQLLLQHAVHGSSQQALAVRFLFESVAWSSVMFAALFVSGVITGWVYEGPDREPGSPDTRRPEYAEAISAASDFQQTLWRARAVVGGEPSELARGLRHSVVTVCIGLLCMGILSTGLSSRVIQSGQVCFLVAAAVMIAGYFASRLAPVRSPLWAILGVFLLAAIGYAWSALRPVSVMLPAHIPTSHFLRILPIQFVAVGAASAVVTFWYCHGAAYDTQFQGDEPS